MYGFKRVLFLVVAGLLVFASRASASTIFQDDFESDSATLCGNTSEQKLPGPPEVGGTWQSDYPTGTVRFLDVVNDTTPYSGTAGTNKYLKIKRNDDSTPHAGAWAALASATPTASAIVEEDFDYQLRSAGSNQGTDIGFNNSAPDAWTGGLFQVLFSPDGSMQYYDNNSATYHSLSTTFTVDQWQHVTVTLNTANRTFSLQVGTQAASGSWTAPDQQFQTAYFIPDTSANRVLHRQRHDQRVGHS